MTCRLSSSSKDAGGSSQEGEAGADSGLHSWQRREEAGLMQGGAGNLTNTTRRGSKYLGAKEKNSRVRRVIINKNYDLIESKPGIAGAYFEYLQMIEAAHDP